MPRHGPSPRAILVVLLVIVALARGALAADTPSYVVIVHPASTYESIDRRMLADVFLKKTTRWRSGEPILPVDLVSDARARERFSLDVIGRSVQAVKSHWQQIIFAGRGLPPPELPDDAAVVRYVASHPGAIGYVSGGAQTAGTRVVAVR